MLKNNNRFYFKIFIQVFNLIVQESEAQHRVQTKTDTVFVSKTVYLKSYFMCKMILRGMKQRYKYKSTRTLVCEEMLSDYQFKATQETLIGSMTALTNKAEAHAAEEKRKVDAAAQHRFEYGNGS